MSYTLLTIGVLLLLLIINHSFISRELFVDLEDSTTKEYNNALDNVSSMEDKLEDMVDTEKETRTFCKLLRHDRTNEEQMTKMLEYRNKQFENNMKKQNKSISQIKKKIIEIKLGKNNTEFMKFNTGRNKKREEYEKRQKIIKAAKKMIKRPPMVNLTFQNNT